MFCLIHGVFVVVLLSNGGIIHGNGPNFDPSQLSFNLLVAAAVLAGSHLVSFFTNYVARGEYRRTILPVLMMQPYARIVVLHLAIIFGAFAIVALGNPVFLLVILIVGKTLLDLALHLREHREDPPQGDPTEGVPTTALDA